jgi:hypothetical protein
MKAVPIQPTHRRLDDVVGQMARAAARPLEAMSKEHRRSKPATGRSVAPSARCQNTLSMRRTRASGQYVVSKPRRLIRGR